MTTVAFGRRTMDDYRRFRQKCAGEPIDGLIIRVGGTASDGLRIISIRESRAHHDRFIARRLHPVRNPTDITVTDFAIDDLLIGTKMPQAHRSSNDVVQDENVRSAL